MRRVITLKDLAKALNVSVTTVSKALNGHPDISPKRKKEIQDYADKMGYIPNQVAKSFRRQKTKLIGILLSNNYNPFNARMIHGIEETSSTYGYRCVLMNSDDDAKKERQLIDELKGLNVAGVIMTPISCERSGCELLKKYDIPYVLVKRYISKDEDTYVVVDDYKAAYIATKHLCSYKNDKVYFLNFLHNVASSKLRIEGYKAALKDCGMTYDPSCVVMDCKDLTDGYENMKIILENHKPPFSVLCYSDYIAAGAMCAIQERGYSLPYDVALAGTDDIEILSFMRPRLTTVAVPKRRLGVRSAELLFEMIDRKEKAEMNDEDFVEEPKREIVAPELILRETS